MRLPERLRSGVSAVFGESCVGSAVPYLAFLGLKNRLSNLLRKASMFITRAVAHNLEAAACFGPLAPKAHSPIFTEAHSAAPQLQAGRRTTATAGGRARAPWLE